MLPFLIALGALALLFFILLLTLYLLVFFVKPCRTTFPLVMPDKALIRRMADKNIDRTLGYVREITELEHEKVFIRSFDGLRLAARLYEFQSGAPFAILCHGYRGTPAADFRGIFQAVRRLGFNILLISERAHWESEGSTICFGIREKLDILGWARFVSERYGEETPIMLYGVSMGAASVLSASALELPKNVRCVVADCGFTSPAAIIKKCAKQLRLGWAYPLVALAGRLFGRIGIRAKGALDAVKETRLPILLMHGEEDDFVPCSMSRELFEACRSEKELYTFPISRHLHSYLLHEEEYEALLRAFLEKHAVLPVGENDAR